LEPTWVSLKDADGKALLEGLMKNGDERNFELQNGAILRVGNAGGLSVRLNGKAIGSLGRHGQVTEVVFRGGGYKTVPRD
jgi:cytoskeleton protein RodZ